MNIKPDLSIPGNLTPSSILAASTNAANTSLKATFCNTWVLDLGYAQTILLAFLSTFAFESGHAYMGDKYLAKKMGCSMSSIAKYLKELEDKGFIFRNSFPIGKGSIRHIIVFDNYKRYWDKFLGFDHIDADVREKYKKWGALRTVQSRPSESTFPKTSNPLLVPSLSFTSHSNKLSRGVSNNSSSHAARARESEAPAGVQNAAAELSETEEIRKMLTEARYKGQVFSKEQIEVGVSYWNHAKETINRQEKPRGYLIYAVFKGIAADRMKEPNLKIARQEATDQSLRENQAAAIQSVKEFSNAPYKALSVSLNKHQNDLVAVTFHFRHPKTLTLQLGVSNNNFRMNLKQAKEKAYASIRDSRKTNTVDAVGAPG